MRSFTMRRDQFFRSLAAIGVLFAVAFLALAQERDHFVSSEVRFADSSRRGLAIVPASCSSNPHYAGECSCPTGNEAPLTTDTLGHQLLGSASSRRVTRFSSYFCITNTTATQYFIPGNSANEIDQFKIVAPTIPGLNLFY